MDERVVRHAEVLVNYSLKIKKGEKVLIQGDVTTLPMLKECYKQVLKQGAFPEIRLVSDELSEVLLKNANDDQILYTPKSCIDAIDYTDAVLSFHGCSNTRILNAIPAEKVKLLAKGRTQYVNKFYGKESEGKLRWCLSLYPTAALAQEAGMSISDYSDFVYSSCMLNATNPIKEWEKVFSEQEKIRKFLDTKKQLHIVSEGTDLKMSIEGRSWINCCGKVNFPDGEIFTSPIEDTVEGNISFTFPGIYSGNEIEGIQLAFKKGKVVKSSAAKGETLLQQILKTDKGASYVGEIAVGTNYNIKKFTKNMLFDEKIGGTVHLAIGRSIPGTGGKNQSAIHWDMLCDMKKNGKIFVDGTLIYEKGNFIAF